MIRRFVEIIEKNINATSTILFSNIQKHFGPDSKTVYIRGTLTFADSSVLEIAIFADELHRTVNINKYRFHYMDKHGNMIFRYDNAPHHHEMPLFPHHKHFPDRVVESTIPSLKDVLNEISAIIIKNQPPH